MSNEDHQMLIDLAAGIVSAYVSNNRVAIEDLPRFIADTYQALGAAAAPQPASPEPISLVPAVSVKKSVTDDFIVCLEDGKRFKSLKRHLMTAYGLSPAEYRQRWSLSSDYPMVAPAYAAARSALARTMGLGRKPAGQAVAEAPAEEAPAASEAAPAPKRRARKAKEAAAAE